MISTTTQELNSAQLEPPVEVVHVYDADVGWRNLLPDSGEWYRYRFLLRNLILCDLHDSPPPAIRSAHACLFYRGSGL